MNSRRLGSVLLVILSSAYLFAGSIEPVTSGMAVWRAGAQATTLSDGRVLITGGDSSYDPRVEMWDPQTKTLSILTAQMITRRVGHSATLLDDGTVFIYGGSWSSTGQAEIFDPGTGTFTAISGPTGMEHAAVKLNDGRVFIVYQNNYTTNPKPVIYNPTSKTFTTLSTLNPVMRYSRPTATLLGDGTVLIAGGETRTAEIYSPTAGTLTVLPNQMVSYQSCPSAIRFSSTEVLFVGGSAGDAEVFDATAKTFTYISSPTWPGTTAALLDSGEVAVISNQRMFLFQPTSRTFVEEKLSYYTNFVGGASVASYPSSGNCSSCASGHKLLIAGSGVPCQSCGNQSYSSSRDLFIYVPTNMSPPPPTIASVTPVKTWTGGGTTVTLDGAGFQQGATSYVGGGWLTVTSTTATQIVGTTSPHSVTTSAGSITVTNPDKQWGSLASAFSYEFRPQGDANGDTALSVGDVFFLVNHLFSGGPAPQSAPPSTTSASVGTAMLSLGKVRLADDEQVVPVYVSGTAELNGFSLQIRSDAADRITIRRAGVTAGMSTTFESIPRATNSVGYLASFADPISASSSPTLIAEVVIRARTGERVAMDIVPATTALAAAGSSRELTVANSHLTIANGSIRIGEPPARKQR